MANKLTEQVVKLSEFTAKMTQKLKDPSVQVDLRLGPLSEEFGSFFGSSTPELRTRFSYHLQKEIRKFLHAFLLPRLKHLLKQKAQPFSFVEQICDIWQNYERFIFALKFYSNAADNTFKSFHKFAANYAAAIKNQQELDKGDNNYQNEVSPVPVMAVNQLKQFLKNEKLLDNLVSTFTAIFCNFLKQQREGQNTQRDKINQALEFVQALHLDFECDCVRRSDKLKIVKSLNSTAPVNRKSTVDAFFEKNFTQNIFQDTQKFYQAWVDNKGFNMPATDEIRQMIDFLDKEQGRAKFYIHDNKNEKKYLDIVESSLVEYKIQQRLRKGSGLRYFLANYQLDKPEMMEQISNFWKVYKRVYSKQNACQKVVIDTYKTYLQQQAKQISKVSDKGNEFIDLAIKLNKKNTQIVSKLLGGLLDFDRIRVEVMEKLMAMDYMGGDKRNLLGYKHWANVINAKLKAKYSKTEKYGDTEADLLNLFKILKDKTFTVNEYCKYLNARMTDDVDMGLEAQYTNALDLESNVLNEIRKQTPQNDIKSIQACLKDVTESLKLRSKLKSAPNMSKFNFFNQILKKSGNHWASTLFYDIQPPAILRNCLTAIRSELKDQNLSFQLQNGTSMFTATIKNQLFSFQFKNIYMIILFLIDEKVNKRMFYNDILKEIKPAGANSLRSAAELGRNLVQLVLFGLLKSNKTFADPKEIDNLDNNDYYEINTNFAPTKKLSVYRFQSLVLPQPLRVAFNNKNKIFDEEQRNIEKDRRLAVEHVCTKMLKHSQTLNGGKGTITMEELLKGQKREHYVTAKYLKDVIEKLINNNICERVEGENNVLKYKS